MAKRRSFWRRLISIPVWLAVILLVIALVPGTLYWPSWRTLEDPFYSTTVLSGPLVWAGQWWRVLTSAFVHTAGLHHLPLYLAVLFTVGRRVGKLQGAWRVAAIMATSQIVGLLAHILFFPQGSFYGAGAICSGLAAALTFLVVRYWRAMDKPPYRHVWFWTCATAMALPVAATLAWPNVRYLVIYAGGALGGLISAMALGRSPAGQQPSRRRTMWGVAITVAAIVAVGCAAMSRFWADRERAYRWLATAHKYHGQNERSYQALKQAAAIAPDNYDTHMSLGWALNDLARRDEALAAYREAACLAPDLAEPYWAIAWTHRRRDEFEKAVAAGLEGIRREPESSRAHAGLAKTHVQAGRYKEARLICQEAIDAGRTCEEIYRILGEAHSGLGDTAKAVSAYRQATEMESPPSYFTFYLLAFELEKQGDYAAAFKAARKADRLAPTREARQITFEYVIELERKARHYDRE